MRIITAREQVEMLYPWRTAGKVPPMLYRGMNIPADRLPEGLEHSLMHHAFHYQPPVGVRPVEQASADLVDYIHDGASAAGHLEESLVDDHPGLGVHWTTDRKLAEKFAAPGRILAHGRGLSVILSAPHPGEHAVAPDDPANLGYRNPDDDSVYDADEIPIRPLTPLSLSSVEIHEPQTRGRWANLPVPARKVNA